MNYEQQIRRDYVLGRFLGGAILGATVAAVLCWFGEARVAVVLSVSLGVGVVAGLLTVQYGVAFWRLVSRSWPWWP